MPQTHITIIKAQANASPNLQSYVLALHDETFFS